MRRWAVGSARRFVATCTQSGSFSALTTNPCLCTSALVTALMLTSLTSPVSMRRRHVASSRSKSARAMFELVMLPSVSVKLPLDGGPPNVSLCRSTLFAPSCTAFSAAPLRRLSATTNMNSAFGLNGSWRSR